MTEPVHNPGHSFEEAQSLTVVSLRKYIDTTAQMTHLSLPERDSLAQAIASVVPAGNVPGLISAGLARLPDRAVPEQESRNYLTLLIKGMQTFLDRAAFQAFFAGPAAALAAYQMLLRMAGKDLDQTFPDGTWQFYVEFGLREDSGRHACETRGFHRTLHALGVKLDAAAELAAWLMASAWLLRRYHDLLRQDWQETMYLRHIETALSVSGLREAWIKKRPYRVVRPGEEYLAYRAAAFEAFRAETLEKAGGRVRRRIETAWDTGGSDRTLALARYERQMSILATLTPGDHSDTRTPIPSGALKIGVIHGKRYHLVDLEHAETPERAVQMAASILTTPPDERTNSLDRVMVGMRRRDQARLRRALKPETQAELEALRCAPIFLNWDTPKGETLSEIRSGQRGIGDHALTVFRTPEAHVFDLSHIFFDGAWGAAISEILTNQAAVAARQTALMPAFDYQSVTLMRVRSIGLPVSPQIAATARKHALPSEVGAENVGVRLDLIAQVRRALLVRNARLRLTVNDLLLLYRTLFGPLYRPSAEVTQMLGRIASDARTRSAGQMALNALDASRQANPAMLIPIDASAISPRERVYPTTFRSPFPDLYGQHTRTLNAIRAFEQGAFGTPRQLAEEARQTRRQYLATLHGFGEVLRKLKDVSMQGESVSTSTLKLLGGLPPVVQRLLEGLPGRVDMLNDLLRGQEVFSNLGQVASSSSLSRFNTAKDDNEKKTLAWGVMTDAEGLLHLSLRDFRPHVAALVEVKKRQAAQRMTQDYLDSYARGLNTFLEEVLFIVKARHQID